jgi:DNA polymerase-3 subunit epsilon
MTDRHLIICDTETTGLLEHHVPLEVGFWDLSTDAHGRFLPELTSDDLAMADPEALRINRYYERGLDREPQDVTGYRLMQFHRVMAKNVLVGSNPSFDAGMLNRAFKRHGLPVDPWFYKMIDIGTYAAGVLSLPIINPPKLATVCELLDIEAGDHSAMGDVMATGWCLKRLQHIANSRRAA